MASRTAAGFRERSGAGRALDIPLKTLGRFWPRELDTGDDPPAMAGLAHAQDDSEPGHMPAGALRFKLKGLRLEADDFRPRPLPEPVQVDLLVHFPLGPLSTLAAHRMAGAARSAASRAPAWRCAAATRASTSASVVSKAHAMRTTPSLKAPRREKL